MSGNQLRDCSFESRRRISRYSHTRVTIRPKAAYHSMRGGAVGVISVASNIVPRAFARLAAMLREGREAEAAALDARLQPVYEFWASNPTRSR